MDLLGTLGVALGLAMLAGINLYLTIFLTGLAVKLGWFQDAGLAGALDGFGHPAVIAVALGLFIVQFIIDKIPWLDSLWDSIHTFLKPAGGVLLALTSLGPDAGAVSQVFVAMLALAGSLLTHGVKASTRLAINTSPEPFSNIGASVAEDLLVIGGFMLLIHYPAVAFLVFAAALALFVYLTPRVTRSIRAILWLIWKKLRVPAGDRDGKPKSLPAKPSPDAEALLQTEFGGEKYHVDWCIHCVTGKTRNSGQICRNLFGELIAIRGQDDKLFFAGSRKFRRFIEAIDLGGALATHESRFISEGIVIHNRHSKLHTVLRFHRGQGEIAERVAEDLQDRIANTSDLHEPGETEAESGDKDAAESPITAAPPAEESDGAGEDAQLDPNSEPEGFQLPPLAPLPSSSLPPAPSTEPGSDDSEDKDPDEIDAEDPPADDGSKVDPGDDADREKN